MFCRRLTYVLSSPLGMGKLRSLSTEEILVQVYYALKVCRVINSQNHVFPKVDNVVYMGMGEPADNAEAVVRAAEMMVDRRLFGLAQSKVTISTVAPYPSAFDTLGQAPAFLAWSVHAVDDQLRRRLVPTTKNTMEELRCALVNALQNRTIKLRRTMLEVALIEGVNDSDEDAKRLVDFSKTIMNDVERSKVVVNLIPYNAIDHSAYRTPSMERVLSFQKSIVDGGVLCYVRTTRGDDESAACGQLSLKKKRPKAELFE
jgi:23S rRNA (adenine2503-C2)-methyltransferase